MRLALSIFMLLLCASCATTSSPATSPVVSLPKLAVPGVSIEDGLEKPEAATIASEYFHRFVCGCGMPGDPQDGGRYWRIPLWGGYGGSDYGTLLIAKNGSKILLEPPKSGFRSSTLHLLKYQKLI